MIYSFELQRGAQKLLWVSLLLKHDYSWAQSKTLGVALEIL